jgi:hypothetical protein
VRVRWTLDLDPALRLQGGDGKNGKDGKDREDGDVTAKPGTYIERAAHGFPEGVGRGEMRRPGEVARR